MGGDSLNSVCRVLLIEDDHAEAQAIQRECCPEPAAVAFDVASTGADAEELLRQGEYDLIICDLALPADNRRFEPSTDEGLRLFELIREQSHGIPVIVLSGHADLHMMKRFFGASADRDLYGTLTEEPLVRFFPKEDLPDPLTQCRRTLPESRFLISSSLSSQRTSNSA